MGPFTFHASLPCLEFGDTLLPGVHVEHQIIRIEQLPWHNSAELKWQCFQPQDEDQWAKDRSLRHSNFHAKLLTVLTSTSFLTSSTLPSPAAFSILAMMPEGPASLPYFILLSALQIWVADTLGGPAVGRELITWPFKLNIEESSSVL